jgi:hypothetical protein
VCCLCVVKYSCEASWGALHESEEWSPKAQHLLQYSQGCRVLVLFRRLLGCAVGFGWRMRLAGRGSEVGGHSGGQVKRGSVLVLLLSVSFTCWVLKSPE